MTKKEVQKLTTEKVTIQSVEINVGRGNEKRILTNMCLSPGEQLALFNALHKYSQTSNVGADVFAYVKNAMDSANIIV